MGFPGIRVVATDGNLQKLIASGDVGAIVASDAIALEPTAIYNIDEGRVKLAKTPMLLYMAEDYYREVNGTSKLWAFSPGPTMKVNDIAAATGATGLRHLMHQTNYEITLMAIACTVQGGAELLTDETKTAATGNTKAFCDAMQARNTPVRILIGAKVADKTKTLVFAPREVDNPWCGIVLGSTEANKPGAAALLLGRAIQYGTHIKIGSGRNGALSATNIYVGDDNIDNRTDTESIHDAGLITFHHRSGTVGYFCGVDNMLTAGDYRHLARGRVVDKATRIIATTATPYIEDTILMNADGSLNETQAADMQSAFETAILKNMTGQISGVKVSINTKQEIINTSTLSIQFKILPLGYMTWIEAEIGLSTTLK
ncbi:MAG: DUF2586 family protein [Muribaculaceae bacterium]